MELVTLEKQLRDKNQDIFRIYQIIKKGMSNKLKDYELKESLNPWKSIVDYYTLHGYQHSKNVLTKLNYLLVDASLNPYELFYILSAVWLHDIGMIEYPNNYDIPTARKYHHITSVNYFKDYSPEYLENKTLPGEFRLTNKDKLAICNIIKYHRRDENIKEVEEFFDRDGIENRVFLRFLCAIFRIADGMDLDNSRAPFYIYEKNRESMPYLNKIFWEKHFPINSIIPNIDKDKRGLMEIEVKFSRSEPTDGRIHGSDMVSILHQVHKDIKSEIDSVPGVINSKSPDFPKAKRITFTGFLFINEEKTADDPDRIFSFKEKEEPLGWSIREGVGWDFPDNKKEKLKIGPLTSDFEIQRCFVHTSQTEKFLSLVSKEYTKSYYLLSPANTGKSTLLSSASWNVLNNNKGIRSYVILIDKKVPTYEELLDYLKKYHYVEDENFICIFDRMEYIPSNIPDPEPLKEIIQLLKNNHHVVWGAGRPWEEFQFTETWKKFIEENFEIHNLPGLLRGADIEKFKPKFEEFFSDEKEMSKFWKLILKEGEIETDSFSQIYMALQGKEIRTVDDEVISIVENNLKRTSSRYDKIYRSLQPWEYNVYCLAYKFHGIFKEIANSIITAFEHREMNFVEEMIENGKIESGFYRFSEKEESVDAIVGIHLNDESRKIMEKHRTTGAIENTYTSLLRNFFEIGSEKACQSIPFFIGVRRLFNPVLLREFIVLVERCRDKFANFLILSYLARETPSLIKYWKELTLQKANTSKEWLFGAAVINFGIAIAQSSENKSDKKVFPNIINLVSNENILNNMGIRFAELHILDYALVAFEKAIKLNPKDVRSWNAKGLALLELGKTEDAIKVFEKAIKLNPKDSFPWRGKGFGLLKLNKTKEAIKAFDKAIKLNPKDEMSWKEKGDALLKLNRTKEAIKVFDESIKINPKNASLWSKKGDALLKLNKTKEVIKAFDKAIKLNPKDEMSWKEKGDVLLKLNKAKEAVKAFDEAIKINPANAITLCKKGIALLKLNKEKEAFKSFDEAIKINPTNTYIWRGKGLALLGLKKTKEAIKVFDEAIKINPKNATLWREKGLALLKLNKAKEAVKAFDEAIKLDPNDVYSWNGKGEALLGLKKAKEAFKVFDEAIKINPNDATLWNGKGGALLKLNKAKEAVKAFDEAIKLDPNDVDSWNGKGLSLLCLDKKNESVKVFNESIKYCPKAASLWGGKGLAFLELNKIKEAIKAFDEAIKLDPNDDTPWNKERKKILKNQQYEKSHKKK
jgi:tetratricopeptide (TPR) repeat protein